MRLLHIWLFVCLCLLSASCVPIAAPTPTVTSPLALPSVTTSEKVLVFENIRVFDGENVLPAATVVVQNGLIIDVEAAVEIPPGAEVVDGTGQTLLPGLIDAHTHVFAADALRQALIFGVTTELDREYSVNQLIVLRAKTRVGEVASSGR